MSYGGGQYGNGVGFNVSEFVGLMDGVDECNLLGGTDNVVVGPSGGEVYSFGRDSFTMREGTAYQVSSTCRFQLTLGCVDGVNVG